MALQTCSHVPVCSTTTCTIFLRIRIREVGKAPLQEARAWVSRPHKPPDIDVGGRDIAMSQKTLEGAYILPRLVALMCCSMPPRVDGEPLSIDSRLASVLFERVGDGSACKWGVIVGRDRHSPFSTSLFRANRDQEPA